MLEREEEYIGGGEVGGGGFRMPGEAESGETILSLEIPVSPLKSFPSGLDAAINDFRTTVLRCLDAATSPAERQKVLERAQELLFKGGSMLALDSSPAVFSEPKPKSIKTIRDQFLLREPVWEDRELVNQYERLLASDGFKKLSAATKVLPLFLYCPFNTKLTVVDLVQILKDKEDTMEEENLKSMVYSFKKKLSSLYTDPFIFQIERGLVLSVILKSDDIKR